MQSQNSFSLSPIAVLRSDFDHKFGVPRQGALAPNSRAHLQLVPVWRDKGMFDALEGFSHVWLISLFHQNRNLNFPSKIHPPRLEGKTVGVLASRSPHRPNPLGLTLAKVERIEGDVLWVTGVDLVDGTPILDIKPYLAEADRPDVFACGWADELTRESIPCSFSAEAEEQLSALVAQGRILDRERFKKLAEEVLALDPRPLSYRDRTNEKFAIVLHGIDVHARYQDRHFTVIAIKPFSDATQRSSVPEK